MNVARRDDEAFGEFMRASSPRLLRIAWLLTGSVASAEDLVQGTLERIYVAWPRDRLRSSARRGEVVGGRTTTNTSRYAVP